MNKSRIPICLVVLLSACHSLTKHQASKLATNSTTIGVYLNENYDKEIYPDGSQGYAYYMQSRPLDIIFKDNTYILSRQDYSYNGGYSRYQNAEYCTNLPIEDILIGNHKEGKCVGTWYTFAQYGVKITPECRKKYKKYIEPEDKDKDTIHVKYYLLNKVETYKNGFLDGNFICYDINGHVIYKTKFTNGTGYYKHFYPLDGIQEEGAYLNGFKQGKWVSYRGLPERDTFVYYYNKGVEIK